MNTLERDPIAQRIQAITNLLKETEPKSNELPSYAVVELSWKNIGGELLPFLTHKIEGYQ